MAETNQPSAEPRGVAPLPPAAPPSAPPPVDSPPASRAAPSPLWRWGKVVLAVSLGAIYAPTLSCGVTFSDGPEITTAIDKLGVIHPTGYPLFTMLAHGFERLLALPIEACIKVEIFNALCVIGASLLAASTARMLAMVGAGAGGQRDVEVGALLAGFMLGTSQLLWAQLRIPEVYAFHVAIVSVAGWAWVRFELSGRDRYVCLAALAMGCGLAHHVTMVYMLPVAFIYLLVRKPVMFISWLAWPVRALARLCHLRLWSKRRLDSPWLFPVACLLGALPLLSYAYLWWANAHTTAVPWGGVDSFDTLYNHATGAQYRRFLGSGDVISWWHRVRRIPVFFDEQFLPVGTGLFVAGALVLPRLRFKAALFLLLYVVANAAHAVFYSVGDYATYYLPAVWAAAVVMGVGGWWLLAWARRLQPDARWPLSLAYAGVFVAAGGGMLVGYARLTKRLPDVLSWRGYLVVALVAAAAGVGLFLLAWRTRHSPRPLAAWVPVAVLLGSIALVWGPTALVRAVRFARAQAYGSSYGAELADNIPPGSVLMVLGDGYLFSMWYQAHVLGHGTDFTTIDLGNVKTGWYQRYLRSRWPRQCDPLAPVFVGKPEAYRDQCGSFAKRLALGGKLSWASLGLRRGRKRPRPVKLTVPVLRGADPQCADAAFFKAHLGKECRCFKLGKEAGVVEEDCAESYDEGGIVPKDAWEVLAQRIIEDSINERPVFERHVLTFWEGNAKTNPRHWDGPRHQRVSGDYAVINRGRYNQIVHQRDIAGFDPCASAELEPLPLRPTRHGRRYSRYRSLYRPNPRPLLIESSYLADRPHSHSDDASRHFRAGDATYLVLGWFEKFYYDAEQPGRRGDPIHHGIRVCFYGPHGSRLASLSTISTGKDQAPLYWQSRADSPPGHYTVRACSVGEIGTATGPLPDGRPCDRTILEYGFEIASGGR